MLRSRSNRRKWRLTLPVALLVILAVLVSGCSLDQLTGLERSTPAGGSGLPPTATPASAVTLAAAITPTAAIKGTSSPSATPQAASPTVAASQAASSGTALADSAGRTTIASNVYRMNGTSVVNITSLAVVRTQQGTSSQPQGLGSGFVLDDQGYIVTNNHVVETAQELTVTFSDGTTVPAQLVGRDPDNDLAVVKVDPSAGSGGKTVKALLKPVKLGDSSKLVVGEDVVAIGSPLGLQQTVTTGTVSALRDPGVELAQGELVLLGGAVQTDAAINPGNSGGPLFNAIGEVVGVNTWGLSPSGGSIGLGFAIPVNVVKRVVPQLTLSGCYKHPLVGITTIALAAMSQATRSSLQLPTNQQGLLVTDVSGGAADAGVKGGNRTVSVGGNQIKLGGDIIVAIDGQPTSTGSDLRAYVENNKKPGDSVTISLLRDGQRQDVTATLGTKQSTVPCR